MVSEILGSAVRSLSSNRLRSSLSVLGIVIGTFAIVFVNAIGNGVGTFVRDRLGFLSATSVFVEPATSGFAPSKLKEEDLEKLLARSRYLSGGTVMSIGKANVGVPGKSEAYMLLGTDWRFLESMKFSIGSGRFFTEAETRESAKVVVVAVAAVAAVANVATRKAVPSRRFPRKRPSPPLRPRWRLQPRCLRPSPCPGRRR